jgi:hypothetical protein
MILFPTNDQYLLRQPINAVTRIMQFQPKKIDLENRLIYTHIELFRNLAKVNPQKIQDKLIKLCCNSWCGLIIVDDIKDIKTSINLIEDDLLGLKEQTPYFYDLLKTLIYEDSQRFLLWFLLQENIQTLQKPMKLYLKFREQQKSLTHYDLLMRIIGSYQKRRNTENTTPCYFGYNGKSSSPSKFYYNKIYLGDGDVATLKIKFSQMLVAEYGSIIPNSNSAHFQLHRIVACVLEKKFKEYSCFKPEMVIEVLKKIKSTKGQKGNIYDSSVPKKIIRCILHFLRVRNVYHLEGFSYLNENASFDEKVEIEMKYFYDKSIERVKFPGMLEEIYSNDGFINKIVSEVEEFYNSLIS